jgi:hypothetical protein
VKRGGIWEYERLEVEIRETDERIDLLLPAERPGADF